MNVCGSCGKETLGSGMRKREGGSRERERRDRTKNRGGMLWKKERKLTIEKEREGEEGLDGIGQKRGGNNNGEGMEQERARKRDWRGGDGERGGENFLGKQT